MTTTENKKAGKLPFSPMVRAFLRKNGEIYVEAQSKLRGTGSVSSEPYFSHTIKDNVLELGTSVLKAKAGSLSYLDRDNYLDYVPPYYEWAGVSDKQFYKQTKIVYIKFKIDHIEFTPLENKRGAWNGINDKNVLLNTDSTDEQIGEQLLKSFEDSVA